MQTQTELENEVRRMEAQKSLGRHIIGAVTTSAIFSGGAFALLLLL